MSHGFGNPRLPFEVFRMLDAGRSLERIREELPALDEFFEYRQLSVITVAGQMWVNSGSMCPLDADHILGDDWAVSGNSLANTEVVEAMARAMTDSVQEDLAERLVSALEAAHTAGGMRSPFSESQWSDVDVPELSSVLFVVDGLHPYPKVDLRVDYHPRAVEHLRRLYEYTKPMDFYYEALQTHPDRVDQFLEQKGVKAMAHFDLNQPAG